jgi:hypothetical protein
MCHNFGPSLIVIIDNTYQYFKNNNFKIKNPYNATCQILMDGWKLLMLALCCGYNYSGVA